MLERNKLPRRSSLKRQADIDRLLKAGNRISGDYFSLVWQKSDDFSYGVLVSKKYGSATKRNRLKRHIREAVRLNRHCLKDTVSLAVLPRLNVGEPDFDFVNAEIIRIFKLINDRA
ncbi:MAG: ribonuclease P protein component [Candidatus Zixiibacteriota bacterium]|nr:MAG: ribonuclease P protein component [candidate division Zixibacteria bacterium]